jgi:cell division protein FtsI (penicillin-binding protein 3)
LLREGKYSNSSHQASFVGYFPADRPRYSCIVVVNAPSKDIYYGNLVAGPIFKAITDRIYVREFQSYDSQVQLAGSELQAPYSKSGSGAALEASFRYLELPLQEQQEGSPWVSTQSTPEGVIASSRQVAPQLVPNVVDMGLKDAVFLLESQGMQVEADGRGTVRQQSQAPGSPIRKGSLVVLNMSIKDG